MQRLNKIRKSLKNHFIFKNPVGNSKNNLILNSLDNCVKVKDNDELRYFIAFHNNRKIEDGPYLVIAKTPEFYKQKMHHHIFLDEHIYSINPLQFIAKVKDEIKPYNPNSNQIFKAPAGILHSIENRSDIECINFCFKALHEKRMGIDNKRKPISCEPRVLNGEISKFDWGVKNTFTIKSENLFTYSIESIILDNNKELVFDNEKRGSKYYDLLLCFSDCNLSIEVDNKPIKDKIKNVVYIRNYNALKIKNLNNCSITLYRLKIHDHTFFSYLGSISKSLSCNYKKQFKYFEPVYKLVIPNLLDKTIVFDFHGTITTTNWVKELVEIYKIIVKDNNKQRSLNWATNIGRGLDKKIESLFLLAQNNGVKTSKKAIRSIILDKRNKNHKKQKLKVDKNLKKLLNYLTMNGHKLYILTGSGLSTTEIIVKLKLLKLDNFFDKENILSCKNNGASKDEILNHIYSENKQIIHFNDYIDGFHEVDKLGGINFGVIDYNNPSQSFNTFCSSETHYVIKSWKSWKTISRIIEYSN